MIPFAAVTAYYNYGQYKIRLRNYRLFAAQLAAQGCPLYTIELAYDDQPFQLTGQPNLLQFRTQSVLWHKENLLNVLVTSLPREIDEIAWLDCDVLFPDGSWWILAHNLLKHYKVVQLFSECCDPSSGYVSGAISLSQSSSIPVNPGIAWAMRRSLWRRIMGLYEFDLAGGGDSSFACALQKKPEESNLWISNPDRRADYAAWAKGLMLQTDNDRDVSFLPGQVCHLSHGNLARREYAARQKIVGDVNPDRDLRFADNGVLEWRDPTIPCHAALRQYFLNRREDDV